MSAAPSMEYVPMYVEILSNYSSLQFQEDYGRGAGDQSSTEIAAALRGLFTLSENSALKSNREALVHDYDKVVPTLLEFLGSEYAQSNSSEQYLALLVLNNVSIPSENKRIIAMNCNAVSILARLLCEDVSCHLMAIILVNLTFADADLRRELVNPNSHMQLVDALSFAFVVSMQDESFENTMAGNHANPRELLRSTMERLNLDRNLAANPQFPETARWCICALKNLTRPSKDPLAAHAVTDSGIVPLLLKILTVRGDYPDRNDAKNEPSMWESNSLQDAALFTILNLATSQPARHYLKEVDTVHTLSGITDFTKNDSEENVPEDSNYKVEQFQCLKARMALAYIVGGEGHYGQAKMRNVSRCLSC